ncbi:putative L-cysteine desulfhydrase 1 isoform X2 [Balamuthia mandrillaris]
MQQGGLLSSPTEEKEKKREEGYRGFGSFHSDNVQELIGLPEEEYQAPPLPASLSLAEWTEEGLRRDMPSSFGRPMLRQHFLLDEAWTFINHGAFGATAKVALQAANKWREHVCLQPLRFIDRELFPYLVAALREFGPYVGASPQDITFLPHATTGLNAVLNSLALQPGEVVCMLDIGYGSVKKMAQHYCQRGGATFLQLPVHFPLASEEDLVSQVSNFLATVQDERKLKVRLFIFDHITSNTALVLPVEELVRLCHRHDVPVLVDGAHALGSLMPRLNLTALNADYYVGNCHKWFCSPQGCGFLWVRREFQETVFPLSLSHGFGEGFTSNFIWDGCRDYSAALVIPLLIKFWKAVDEEKAQHYMRDLITSATALLQDRWQTSDNVIAPSSMFGTMALVGLPENLLQTVEGSSSASTSTDAKTIQDKLHYEHKIEVPVKCVQGKLYVRISAHIYNELEDYQRLADAISEIAAQSRASASRTPQH